MSKIITIYGNNNSGKTTVATQLAKNIKGRGKSVIILCTDLTVSTVPHLLLNLPKNNNKSLKNVLDSPISQENILKNLIAINDNIFLLGFNYGESYNDYTFLIEKEEVSKLLLSMQAIADYVIVDATQDIAQPITRSALCISDVVINVLTADIKGATHFLSTDKHLQNLIPFECKKVTLLNKMKNDELESFTKNVTTFDYLLYFSYSIEEAFDKYKLFSTFDTSKEMKIFDNTLDMLMSDIEQNKNVEEDTTKGRLKLFKRKNWYTLFN